MQALVLPYEGKMAHFGADVHHIHIGPGSNIQDGARVGRQSLIAAGAVVREGMIIPPRSLVAGVPGQVKRQLSDRELELISVTPKRYVEYAQNTRRALQQAGL